MNAFFDAHLMPDREAINSLPQPSHQRQTALGLLLLLLFSVNTHAQDAGRLRPLTPEDLFRLEELGEVALSPDGQWVAYVVKRPKEAAVRFGLPFLFDNDHADVWLHSLATSKSENITEGATDGSGFWGPKWSPDGQRLAMLSTRGDNVQIWLWTRSNGALQMLSERGVEPWSGAWDWASDHELVFWALPEGEKSRSMTMDTQIAQIAPREWAKAWKGQESTASVLESGIEPSMEGRSQSQILLIDTISGKKRVLSTAAPGFSSSLNVSPDHRFAAFLKQVGVWHPDSKRTTIRPWLEQARYQIAVTELSMPSRTQTMTGVRDVFWGSVLWSPDSTELAVMGYDQSPSADREQLFRCRVADGDCRPASSARLNFSSHLNYFSGNPPYLWYGKHELLARCTAEDSSPSSDQQELFQWWKIDEKGDAREFFADVKNIPNPILPEAGRESLIGIIQGSIWRINKDGQAIENLTPRLDHKVRSIEWPPEEGTPAIGANAPAGVEGDLIFAVGNSAKKELYKLDLKSGQITPVPKPASGARLDAHDEQRGTNVFSANDRTGTYLWVGRPDKQAYTTALETNTFLREIAEGELRKLDYRSLDGKDLKGWFILPFGYEEGKRYPVVVWVYLRQMFADDPPENFAGADFYHINSSSFGMNLQLLAAHGYVVLLPSMPAKPHGEDPYFELTKGVLPAVDKLVDLGVADRDRIGVMGHSYGAYSTEGLIEQTNLFKAAVALNGVSNQVSSYGTFDARQRYEPFAHEDLLRMWNSEDLGVPFWKDVNRYLRNSPINYVERVQTPLLMVHGDLDPIPIQQDEEFFTALYRQNKRAEFVRYWGEDHVLDSPANIGDMWRRIYAWFDEFLNAGRTQGGSSSGAPRTPQH